MRPRDSLDMRWALAYENPARSHTVGKICASASLRARDRALSIDLAKTMTRHGLLGGLAFLVLGLAGCRRGDDDSTFPRNQSVVVGGSQWGEPSTFNPLLNAPDWPVNSSNLIYETLFIYDLNTGKMEPLLAESYEVKPDVVEVVMNPAARFNDGTPVSALDVKYTFEIGKRFKSAPMTPLWTYITEVRLPEEATLAPGALPRKLEFVLDKEHRNPLLVLDALQGQRIVPRHVFEPLFASHGDDLNEINKLKFDKDPVGSGPYKLRAVSSEKIVAMRDDNYWGNAVFFGGRKPLVKYVIHPIYKSNDAFSVALQQGRMDASSSFVPRIWLKQKKGVHAWYDKPPYFAAGCIPMLFLNVTHKPLGDPHLRRAMAFAINYKDIRELAVSGYSEPMQSGLILPFGLEGKYFSKEDSDKYGASTYDPARAKEELAAGGYKPVFGPTGELLETRDAQGNKVPTVYIKSPTGWSDWESIVRIAVKGMRAAGIDARERFVDASIFWQALFAGDFDLIMNTPVSSPTPSKPWSRFEGVLTSADWVPDGDKMYKNYGRFNNPKAPDYEARVDELLKIIPNITDEEERLKAYRELNVLFMKLQPTLPLVYRPDQFYEFSVRQWTGFPTAENPFLPPQLPGDRLGTRILWHLKPAG
jgi:peptide/nickel transport system substrate-binding protein